LNPHTWYGVFISRFSSNQDRGAIFVYDTSNVNGAGTNYVNNLQQVLTPNPAGYSKTGATANFYIDIGGDSQISTPCNCEITNFNFLYKRYFSNDVNVALELIKSPPSKRVIK